MDEHLSEREFVSYTHQTTTDVERTTMDRHLANCPRCQATLSDHVSLQKHIQHGLQADLAIRPSSHMTFAAIAPRLQRHKLTWVRPAQQFASGVVVLATLIAFSIIMAALFESISRPSSNAGSVASPRPSPIVAAVTYTASLVVTSDGQIRLIGYDLSTTRPAPGTILTVTLYWQALRELTSDYTTFVQLFDTSDRTVAVSDGAPAGGTRPTTSWRVGEPVTDTHALILQPDLATGGYWLKVGLYDPTTLVQLGSVSLDQAVVITTSILTRCTGTYVISPGDTLVGIAQGYGTSPQTIMDCNGNSLDRLGPGDTIKVPTPLTATIPTIIP
jgi:LysM repeat protein